LDFSIVIKAMYHWLTQDFLVTAVERTFLGYLRTSTVLAMLGTLVAQLFTINAQDHRPNSSLLGKPLATIFFTLAIVTVGLGAIRNYRHQSFLIEGKALAGGVEIHILSLLSLLVSIVALTWEQR
jgi:uncharacterized membrane protein YidH (DUF202 family)